MTIFRHSSIDCAYSCLRKYKHVYIDGLETDSESLDCEFGTALHLAIKSMFDKEDYTQVFLDYWDVIQGSEMRKSRFDWHELQLLGKIFLERFNKLHFKKFVPYKLEQQMEVPFGGHTLQGTADLIGEYEGVPSIVDWKTSASEYKRRKILTSEQMYIYAYMAKELYNYEAKQLVYKVFIKSEERIQTEKLMLTSEKLNDMMDNVRAMVSDLSTRQSFPRNPNCYCTFPQLCHPGGLR